MLKTTLPRLLLVPVLGFGCVFTSRPQLPANDAAMVYDAPTTFEDAAAAFDTPAPPPVDADRSADAPPLFDSGIPSPMVDAASDLGATENDFCLAPTRGAGDAGDAGDASDASDAGFFNARGQPCDPATYDGGRPDASDGGSHDGGDADVTSDGGDGAPHDGSDATGAGG